MRRSSWIIQVSPRSSDKSPYNRHTEKLEEEGASMSVEEEAEDVDTLGMLVASRSWKGPSAVQLTP